MFPISYPKLEQAIVGAKARGGFRDYDAASQAYVSGETYFTAAGDRIQSEAREYRDGRKLYFAAVFRAADGFTFARRLDEQDALAVVRAMADVEVIGQRRWPAWFTVDQMRAQLEHEAQGCPPPRTERIGSALPATGMVRRAA